MALTPRQQAFVEEYLIDLNATAAAKRAGYSPKTANQYAVQLLARPEVSEAIEAGRKARSEKAGVSQDYVLETLLQVTRRCMQQEQVFDRSGKPVVVETEGGEQAAAYTFNAAGATRAAELLGKHLGMFSDRLEMSGRNGAPIQMGEADVATRVAALVAVATARMMEGDEPDERG